MSTLTAAQMRQHFQMDVVLEQHLDRVRHGRACQGMMVDADNVEQVQGARPELEALLTESGVPFASVMCTARTRPADIYEAVSRALGMTGDAAWASDLQLPEDECGCLLLSRGELLPNITWRWVLQLMKGALRENKPLLVITTTVTDRKLGSRLYGLDGDSSMMWSLAYTPSAQALAAT